MEDNASDLIKYNSAKEYSISILGNIPISEILNSILFPALQNRKEEWIREVGRIITELQNHEEVQIDDLSKNELFIDTLLRATSYALKTSDKEKINIFKNAIANTALDSTPDETMNNIFLNLIDSFTIWHIKILSLVDDPELWFHDHDRQLPNFMFGSLSTIIIAAFPELKGQDDLLELIWSDLGRAGLHRSGDLRTTMSSGGMTTQRTTRLGKRFLQYISKN